MINDLNKHEQLIRQVTEIGNGAHIFAPKEWIDEKVLIVRLEKKTIKEEILEILYPHLDKIITVLLYGSYARDEADKDSDIDILVIAKEKFKPENKSNIEFTVVSEDSLDSAIKINPIMMYSIFREAKPIINQRYLEELKDFNIDSKLFKPFLKSTEDSISSDEEILELDRKTGKTASNSILYSLILRLRGIFIINALLRKEAYSNKLFRKWVTDNCKVDYNQIYSAYRTIRAGKEIKDQIVVEEAEILIKFLKEELKKLEAIIIKYGK